MQRSTSTKSLSQSCPVGRRGRQAPCLPRSLSSAAKVGVTAAVNTDARGRAPGAAPRVLALGNTVVFNEEITTDGSGLVQILLLDGTTFTVGPNSQLTIDEFVYNPATGDAKVVASLTKGAFRFVGAPHQPDRGRRHREDAGRHHRHPRRGDEHLLRSDSGKATASLVAGNSFADLDRQRSARLPASSTRPASRR